MDFTKEINVEIEKFQIIPGRDGFSPILESEEVEGGHVVHMTDKEGEKEFFVRDGKDYEHSEEFTRLANQVHRDAETSTAKVLEVIEYGNKGKDAIDKAKTEAVNDVNTARNDAESAIQAKRTSAENAIDADRSTAISQIAFTKTSAVNAVNEAKTAAIGAVNDAKDSAIGAVNSTKETAVSAVEAKQTEAVNAVNAAAEAFFDEYPLEKVEAIESNVTSLIERVDNIDDVIIETVEPLQKQADRTERSLDALWKLNRGQTYDFETVETESYSNDVPSGALMADVQMIGGKSIVMSQLVNIEHPTTITRSTMDEETKEWTLTYPEGSTASSGLTWRLNFTEGHKYYIHKIIYDIDSPSGQNFRCSPPWNNSTVNYLVDSPPRIFVWSSETCRNELSVNKSSGYTAYKTAKSRPIIIDLTLLGLGEIITVEEANFELSKLGIDVNEFHKYTEQTIVSADVDEVEVRGKNLFGGDALRRRLSEIGVANVEGNDVNVRDTTASGKVLYDKFKPDTRYTFVLEARNNTDSTGATNNSNIRAYYTDGTYSALQYVISTEMNKKLLVSTSGKSISSLRGINAVSSKFNINPDGFGVFEGVHTLEEFEPYHEEHIPIPDSIRSLEGYGWSAGSVYNYVDFARKKFVQRVGRVDLGTENYNYTASNGTMNTTGKITSKTGYSSCLIHLYTQHNVTGASMLDYDCKIIDGSFYAKDPNYTSASEYKSAMNGVMLYYELATPIETDISDILDSFEVESGGTITFHQTDDTIHLPIPNRTEYAVKLSEVN